MHVDDLALPALGPSLSSGSLLKDHAEALGWPWPSPDGSQAWKPPKARPGHLGFPSVTGWPLLAGSGLWKAAA